MADFTLKRSNIPPPRLWDPLWLPQTWASIIMVIDNPVNKTLVPVTSSNIPSDPKWREKIRLALITAYELRD